MKHSKRILTAALALFLMLSVSVTAFATDPAQGQAALEGTQNGEAELTEEQKLQQELDAIYAIPVESNGVEGWPQGPGTYGEAAIVMEVDTGAILYAKNIDGHFYPASITKLLTALLALEYGQLTDPVVFSHECVSFLKPDEASIGMKEGNQISLEQALYATLLASANETAYAVAENVGKNAGYDYNWFIEQMNARCQELGGGNSNFVNSCGLHDPNHYTCARDMALIGRELFKHPEFFAMAQTSQYMIPASETTEEHVFQQHHKMLLQGDPNYYEFAIGGKTGYTSDALSTLVTMADNGSMKLVCVVLKTHGVNIYPDTKNLLDYAFTNFSKVSAAEYETSEDIAEVLTAQSTDVVTESTETGQPEAAAADGGVPVDPVQGADGMVISDPVQGADGMVISDATAGTDGTVPETAAGTDGMVMSEAAASADGAVPEAGVLADSAGAELTEAEIGSDTGDSGYVILPNGMEFSALDMEIIPDSDVSSEGTVEYRYGGNFMGSARAVLSQSYLEKQVAADEDSDGAKTKSKVRDSKKIGKISGLLSEKTLAEKCILGGGGIVLVILIALFIKLLNRQK